MKLISPFLKIQQQLRIFHWQTESYAQHKAFGKAYEALDGLIDDFVEVYMGQELSTKHFLYRLNKRLWQNLLNKPL
jgi:hypothetical protein